MDIIIIGYYNYNYNWILIYIKKIHFCRFLAGITVTTQDNILFYVTKEKIQREFTKLNTIIYNLEAIKY